MNGKLLLISRAFYSCCLAIAGGSIPAQTVNSPASSDQPEPYRLKVDVQRVVVDVVVTDAKGQPVTGLKQDDFKVMEDGAVQTIRFFDAHVASTTSPSQRAMHLDLPHNTFSNLSLASPDTPVTILLFDVLDTPGEDLPFARQELIKFIKRRKGATQIAIFALTDRLHMLQGFTDDETRLVNAVNSKETSEIRILRDAPLAMDASQGVLDLEIQELIYQGRKRNTIAANALAEIARFACALPGRKNLIWMSGAFPADVFADRPRGSDVHTVADIRAAQNLMRDSRIAVYPVDIGGLHSDPLLSAAEIRTGPAERPLQNIYGHAMANQDAGMEDIAESTGGHAFYGTNGLEEAVDAAVKQGSSSYSLTYEPSNSRRDGSVRNIKVALSNPRYQLSYRRRYVAPDAVRPAPDQPLVLDTNMQHGEPNSSELFFVAQVVPVGARMLASADEVRALEKFVVSAGGKTSPAGSENVQHYSVSFAILGRQLQMPAADGERFDTDMRFGLAAYSRDGALLNGAEVVSKALIPAAQREKIESEGYHASMVFPIPEGAASLRIAVRDEIGKRLGTMEVPLPIPLPRAGGLPASK